MGMICILVFALLSCKSVCAQFSTDIWTIYTLDSLAGDQLGYSAAMDANRAYVLGANYDADPEVRRGSAYLFVPDDVSHTSIMTSKLSASDGAAADNLGVSVDINGDVVVVGAYQADPGGVLDAGAVYVYVKTTIWPTTETQKLIASDGATNDYFGRTVALATDANHLAIGAPGKNTDIGAVYYFIDSGGGYVETQIIDAAGASGIAFGWSLHLHGDVASGMILLVGAPSPPPAVSEGRVEVYIEDSGTLIKPGITLKISTASDRYGTSVSAYGTPGSTIIAVGATGPGLPTGQVYIYEETTVNVYTQVIVLSASDGASGDYFGFSISLLADLLVIGAPSKTVADLGTFTGGIYVFQLIDTVWTETWQLDGMIDGEAMGFNVVVGGPTGTNVISTNQHDEAGGGYFVDFDPIDDCLTNTCLHGGTCTDQYYNFTCDCIVAYDGVTCDQCICENGVCADDIHTGLGYCECQHTHFAGNLCQNPCYNGWSTADSKDCNCTGSGATGSSCHKDIDDCLSNPCFNDGTCADNGTDLFPNHNNEFNCSCPAGYFGLTCIDTLCYSSPCLNNGTCDNGRDVVCNCTGTGYEGDFCQTEIDECASSPCLNGGTCTDFLEGYLCLCPLGWEGINCATDSDDCDPNPCLNGATCKDKGVLQYKCTCVDGYEGDLCARDIDECLSSPCLLNQVCTDYGPMNFTCTCVHGFSGTDCTISDIDASSSSSNDVGSWTSSSSTAHVVVVTVEVPENGWNDSWTPTDVTTYINDLPGILAGPNGDPTDWTVTVWTTADGIEILQITYVNPMAYELEDIEVIVMPVLIQAAPDADITVEEAVLVPDTSAATSDDPSVRQGTSDNDGSGTDINEGDVDTGLIAGLAALGALVILAACVAYKYRLMLCPPRSKDKTKRIVDFDAGDHIDDTADEPTGNEYRMPA